MRFSSDSEEGPIVPMILVFFINKKKYPAKSENYKLAECIQKSENYKWNLALLFPLSLFCIRKDLRDEYDDNCDNKYEDDLACFIEKDRAQTEEKRENEDEIPRHRRSEPEFHEPIMQMMCPVASHRIFPTDEAHHDDVEEIDEIDAED